ncbi:MAG: flagellar hook assembly protein FlgD [Burkholderiaceae bacterium]|nr:flagellar hook assembly protein FlgD [Burkholderiaceae bacterium]
MFTFPKSIANPAAAPVAGFVANKTTVPPAGSGAAGEDSFSRALKNASTTAADRGGSTADAGRANASGASSGATAPSDVSLDNDNSEDKFLTLLVAQMRNQDPLNPLDNAQVTSQLAQINTVRGIEKLNTSMHTLVDRIGAQGALDAAGLIDREVLAEGDAMRIGEEDQDSVLAAAFQLPAAAERVSLQVFDEAGLPVADMPLGALDAGVHPFEWDGRDADGNALDPGTYYFQVSAMNDDGQVNAVTLVPSRVVGVTRNGNSFDLQLASGAMVDRDSVRGVR